jgi:hypothetical protein
MRAPKKDAEPECGLPNTPTARPHDSKARKRGPQCTQLTTRDPKQTAQNGASAGRPKRGAPRSDEPRRTKSTRRGSAPTQHSLEGLSGMGPQDTDPKTGLTTRRAPARSHAKEERRRRMGSEAPAPEPHPAARPMRRPPDESKMPKRGARRQIDPAPNAQHSLAHALRRIVDTEDARAEARPRECRSDAAHELTRRPSARRQESADESKQLPRTRRPRCTRWPPCPECRLSSPCAKESRAIPPYTLSRYAKEGRQIADAECAGCRAGPRPEEETARQGPRVDIAHPRNTGPTIETATPELARRAISPAELPRSAQSPKNATAIRSTKS